MIFGIRVHKPRWSHTKLPYIRESHFSLQRDSALANVHRRSGLNGVYSIRGLGANLRSVPSLSFEAGAFDISTRHAAQIEVSCTQFILAATGGSLDGRRYATHSATRSLRHFASLQICSRATCFSRRSFTLPRQLLGFSLRAAHDAATRERFLRCSSLRGNRAQRRSDRLRHTCQKCFVLGALTVACFHFIAPFVETRLRSCSFKRSLLGYTRDRLHQ